MDRGSAGLLRHHLHQHHQQAGLLPKQAVRREDPHRQHSEQQRPREPNVSETHCNKIKILKIVFQICVSFINGAPCWVLGHDTDFKTVQKQLCCPLLVGRGISPTNKWFESKPWNPKQYKKYLLAHQHSHFNAPLSGSLRCICHVLAPLA